VALLVQGAASLLIWGGLALAVSLLPFSTATRTILWLVGASLPFYAITSVTQTFFQASERLELVMGVELLINTLILGLSTWILWHGGGILRLVAILVATQVMSALIGLLLLRVIRLLASPQESIKVDLATLRQLATPFYGLALADVLLQRVDILLLSIVAGETVTGIYSAAYQFIRVLLKLVQSFWKALYPTLSRLHSHSATHYQRLSNLSLNFSLLALLAGAAVGAGVAQPLLHLIFGARYLSTGPVFALLIWSAPLFLLETYAGTILLVERRPFHSLLITGIHVLLIVLCLPPLTQLWQANGAASAVLLAGVVGALLSLWLLVYLGYAVDGRKLAAMVIAAALALVACVILPLPWVGRAVAGTAIYALIAWQFKVIQRADWQTLRLGILGRRR
jgi:O-antigen/teichoic acid export membrane protein